MTGLIAILLLLPVALVLVVWAGTRMLRQGGPTSSSNAFGGFDVFAPTREDAERDLESKRTQVVVMPATDDHDHPLRVDIQRNTARIRRPVDPPGIVDDVGDQHPV